MRNETAHSEATVLKLRDESIEAQRARVDLLKWKLIISGALGSVALFPVRDTCAPILGLLAGVPLGMLYIDLMCHALFMRSLVIGKYLRTEGPSETFRRYEKYVGRSWTVLFLENVAVHGSTIVVSLALLLFVLFPQCITDSLTPSRAEKLWIGVSAALTLVISIGIWVSVSRKGQELEK